MCTQGPAVDGEPGVGPLRIWPGGLCVSRSVGDTDAGPHIVPIPHVKQVGVRAGEGVGLVRGGRGRESRPLLACSADHGQPVTA